ncbi:MAG: hypothetical protein AAFN78_06915 [Pseudomonadota bacterium]
MTRKRIVRRTAGTLLLLFSLGLTNCQAVFSNVGSVVTPLSDRAPVHTPAESSARA